MIIGVIILLSVMAGLMGAWTGAGGSKLWRRLGIPLIFSCFAYVFIGNPWVFTILIMFGVLSMGYGIPTPPSDPGSPIGAFWYKIFNSNEKIATAATRLTLGVLMVLCCLSVPIITDQWFPIYAVFCIVFLFNQVLWTVLISGLGLFNFLGKALNKEEFCLYSCNSLIVLTMIVLASA